MTSQPQMTQLAKQLSVQHMQPLQPLQPLTEQFFAQQMPPVLEMNAQMPQQGFGEMAKMTPMTQQMQAAKRSFRITFTADRWLSLPFSRGALGRPPGAGPRGHAGEAFHLR